MTPETKKVVKTIAVSMGVILIVVSIVVIIYKKTKGGDESEDTFNPFARNTEPIEIDESKYSRDEIERMQSWLIAKATEEQNNLIIDAIRDTGGIDGDIGEGFVKAINEAIRKGYVKDLEDLYKKSNQ